MADNGTTSNALTGQGSKWKVYLAYISASLVFVWVVAALQLTILVGRLSPVYFLVPSTIGILFGSLLARLRILKMQVETQRALFQSVTDSRSEFTWLHDQQGRLSYVSPAALQVTGIHAQALENQPERLEKLFGADNRSLFRHHLVSLLERQDTIRFEFNICTPTGVEKSVICALESVVDDHGHIIGVMGHMQDVSRDNRVVARLKRQLRLDEDTGLGNVRLLTTDLDLLVANKGRNHVLLQVHLAGLQHVLELYGPALTNRFIAQLANRIQKHQGGICKVYRSGKGEFTILLEDCTEAQFKHWLQHLQQDIEAPVDMDGIQLSVGMRAGVAMFPADADERDTWLERTELAMQAAVAGEERWSWYRPVLETQRLRRQQVEQQLVQAVARGKLKTYMQAVYRADPLQMAGVELLGYWQDAESGWQPLEPHMEKLTFLGMSQKVMDALLAQALPVLKRLDACGMQLRCGVNIQSSDLLDRQFIPNLNRRLLAEEFERERVILEVGECTLQRLNDYLLQRLRDVRTAGFVLAVDHFGLGPAALKTLTELPVQVVKVELALIRDATEEHRLMVSSVVALGRRMGLDMLLNNVSEPSDIEYAHDMQVTYLQGPLLQEPLPVDQFEAWAMHHASQQ